MRKQNQISEAAKEAATLEIQQNLDVSFGKDRGKFVQACIDAATAEVKKEENLTCPNCGWWSGYSNLDLRSEAHVPMGVVSADTGAALIAKERERQVSEEGWLSDHDDSYNERELARVAAAYIMHYVERQWLLDYDGLCDRYRNDALQEQWPDSWSGEWFKPYDRIRDLTRAGALIAAEIDRLLRAQGSEVPTQKAPTDSAVQKGTASGLAPTDSSRKQEPSVAAKECQRDLRHAESGSQLERDILISHFKRITDAAARVEPTKEEEK